MHNWRNHSIVEVNKMKEKEQQQGKQPSIGAVNECHLQAAVLDWREKENISLGQIFEFIWLLNDFIGAFK